MKTNITYRGTLRGLIMGLALTVALTASATVQVRGLGHSSGENVTVEIYADITSTPIISYSFRLYYDPRTFRVIHGLRDDSVWYLSDGQNLIPYVTPDVSVPGQVLFVGARMDGNDPLAGVAGPNVLLGLVVFERLNPETPSFDVTIGHEGDYASFVTRDGAILDSLPGQVSFEGVWPVQHDKDLDGLGDEWEVAFFKEIELAYWSDDPDRDDYNNLSEEALGTDPTNRRSNLQFRVSWPQPDRLLLEWTSTQGRIYMLQFSKDLERFRPLITGIKATPPNNSETIAISGKPEANFYKIMLESWPGP